jgi:xylulose-5-phosphate/fructose-6-phosphate phosphoketolase
MTANNNIINPETFTALEKYLRFANYISAAQIYLKDNFLLTEELSQSHLKTRPLGHWGTVPGLNFLYANLNLLIKRHQQKIMLVVGPGHGYPALLANLYMEGSLGEYYPDYILSKSSFGRLIKNFSWPGGFPSHSNPETPGVILEGGELGYALSTAFGAAFDNPDLIVACVVGDGEAETGPTATAWHSTKFLNPKTSGAVLPIVHINKYKISGPTIYGTMSHEELTKLFEGYGYEPIIVDAEYLYEPMLEAMENAYQKIKFIQSEAREKNIIDKPRWPVILFIHKKGWTGPKTFGNKMIEDSFRSHGVPLEHAFKDNDQFLALKSWLESYNVQSLFADQDTLDKDILSIIPNDRYRMGMVQEANGGILSKELILPNIKDHEKKVKIRGSEKVSNMFEFGKYLRDIVSNNLTNFRVMSPDETESNKLGALFDVTKRGYLWPVPTGAENISYDGRVMEILSEHTLQGWLHGYLLTGRHGILVSYEAFMMITASMVDQYAKFLEQMKKVSWREPVPSLNIVLTSTGWRQEHNGFSHQNPGFISSALNQQSDFVNIHFPPDTNMLLATMQDCFKSKGKINIIVSDKRDLPQYLNMNESLEQINSGIGRWKWAGNHEQDPDIVFVATGDHATYESLATINIFKEVLPELKTRFISVSELSCFGIGDNRNQNRHSAARFQELFTADRHILYSYHGYPEDIKQLIFGHPDAKRFKIYGYIEQGTTTTPFDMLVKNRCSRYHLAIDAIKEASKVNPDVRQVQNEMIKYFESMLMKHHLYVEQYGIDMPEITDFELKF